MKNNDKVLHDFSQNENYTPRNPKEKLLVKVLLSAVNEKEMANLLRDLLTLPEIEIFANRMVMAKMLASGRSYKAIAKEMKVSTTSVTRVAHWLFRGCGGYQKALKKLT